ncbi:hypothetical protein G7076_02735 [Sphingomonas sp. HDW15A]|uniref:S41 family peptidase n=1 Tax=Sphingomonas sp. HDW15A TaxID=2714942 RepID=UPI001408A4DD|nr:S41 family peptidase [Sphingomonas sp. HDW15A]QIK95540.1 hypothetical protein G7076_02735 [Sphingomonas sp. HDW15A]
MKMTALLSMLALAIPSSLAHAEPAAEAWRTFAKIDSAAAIELIEKNHPGASPELGDLAFQKRLAVARRNAGERLPKVVDYPSYAALMNGLANDFRDGHIWSNARLSSSQRRWAGIIIARRGGQWVVGAQDAAQGEQPLEGARLISCDGVPADRFAREKLGEFYAHPDIEADMATRAAQLLIDDGNPFVAKPAKCQFATSSGTVTMDLNWRDIPLRQLEPIVLRSYRPAEIAMGISDFAGGKWISVPTFGNAAASLVEKVRESGSTLRAAPMIVLDLRGNSGGNSGYAEEIARILVGEARVSALSSSASGCSGLYWRVSPDNLTALRNFVEALPEDRKPNWNGELTAMKRASERGEAFAPALPACAPKAIAVGPPPPPNNLPPSAYKGRLILLTDRACFSSCLIAANLFRRLGALHVGEATDMSTRYMEVREIVLPSGLRTFSTLQKVALGLGDFGPYEPSVVYPGQLHEDDKVKAWVAALPR